MTIDNAERHWQEQQALLLNEAAINMSEILADLVPNYSSDDPHMMETPERFVKMLMTLTTPEDFTFTTFETKSDEMVVSHNIPFYTFCAHHILPFHGVCHIGYIPDGKLVGVSKLARLMEWHCRALNVQEELTRAIADDLNHRLSPKGVAVQMKAEHLCQTMRGVEKPGAIMTTSAMLGAFADHTRMARAEFLAIVREG